MDLIVFREMKAGEEQTVCDLVKQVFNEFVALDYENDGIEEFFRFANPDALKERMQSDGFVLVAFKSDVLVGMLEFFPPDIIAMLFVTVRQQGIAKELLTQAISKARLSNPNLSKLTVHSSTYAEAIYQQLGFQKTGEIAAENGITYVPMELLLDDQYT